MIRWFKEHSLSLVLTAIWWVLTAVDFLLPESTVQQYLGDLSGDAFGAWLVVVLTKWFTEKGSAESK